MAADLDEDQNKQLTDYISQLSQNGGQTAVATSQPSTPATPALVPTNRGSAEEDESTKGNDDRILDSNPGHAPEDLLATETADKMAQASKFGPDQEKMVMDSIAKNEGSIQNRLSRGAAGLGDAIMGVAGKSGPGFLNSFENREENQNKRAMEALPTLQGMNEKQMAQKQALEGQSNATPLGKAKADFLRPLIMKLFPGKDPEAMLRNPDAAASMIGIPADVYKSEVEARIKGKELNLQGRRADVEEKRLESDIENQREQRKQEEEQRQLTAAQDIGKGSKIPFFGPSHAEKQAALAVENKIASGSNHGIPDLGSTFNGHKVIGVKRIK